MLDKVKVPFSKVESVIELYKGVPGIYVIRNRKVCFYVGKAHDLHHRFKNGYMNENTGQHVAKEVKHLIKTNSHDSLQVALYPVPLDQLEEMERKAIRKHIPWGNDKDNPRYSRKTIQKMIGDFINIRGEEAPLETVRQYFKYYWRGDISMQRIDEALNHHNISDYVSINKKKQILKPKR